MRSFGSVDNVIRVDRRAIRRFSSQLGNPITVSASISKYSFLPYWPTAESTRFSTESTVSVSQKRTALVPVSFGNELHRVMPVRKPSEMADRATSQNFSGLEISWIAVMYIDILSLRRPNRYGDVALTGHTNRYETPQTGAVPFSAV